MNIQHVRRLAIALVGGCGLFVAVGASAEEPKCPDTSKVRSGTDFCASENVMKNFPTIAFCESPDERQRKVCPVEWIESMWALQKQGSIDPYQREVEAMVLALEERKAAQENPDGGVRRGESEESLRKRLCIRGHQISAELIPRLKSWRHSSAGKYAVATIAEADRTLKDALALEPYCKPPADAGAEAGAKR